MAETTAQDVIQDALEKIQAYAPGEVLSAADADRALNVINNMIDSWSTEGLTIFAAREQSVTLAVGQTRYTISDAGGADIALPRPLKLYSGPGSAFVTDTNGNRYELDVVTQDQWNRIWNITAINSSWPTTLFYDPQYPLGVLNFYPQPNQAGMVASWDSYLPLTQFTALTGTGGTFSFPPGYKLSIVDCAARRLWRYFKKPSEPIPADIVADAAGAKRNIKRINYREQLLGLDPALTARGGAYNPYSDSVGRR